MIKKILPILLLITSINHAQHTIKGSLSPNIDTDWLILYKIEGTKQVFVNNTTIKKDSILISGKYEPVGSFEIVLPPSAKSGTYRATYRLEGSTFIDFVYNQEDVSFIFNPDYPQESVAFTFSSENILYKKYIADIAFVQKKLDSIQIAVLKDPSLELKEEYKQAYQKVNSIQNKYVELAKGKYVAPFIFASARSNSPEILTSINDYIDNVKNSFFSRLDFSNKSLMNSSFLTNRVLDYVFYINYSEDIEQQQVLYKNAIETVLSKVKSIAYQRDIIQFLIEQFESSKNLEIIDYLFENHYDKLPIEIQNSKFKAEKQALFAAEIGRTAPDFSWTENGRNLKLSTLNDAEMYVLVFWSTGCSHCLREIPLLHTFMKTKPNAKVIGFALENDAFVWETYSKNNLDGWHNVLGLNKWKNETAQVYQIFSTPTYFILDRNKKIIAKPNAIKDVKAFLEQ